MSLATVRKWFHLRLPNALVSRAFGYAADLEFPTRVQGQLNQAYARLVGVDVSESEHPPENYRSLTAFFTRRLKSGLRPSGEGAQVITSPVDARLAQRGMVPPSGELVQVKGVRYSLAELLGSASDARRFTGGAYATLYLSPRDYHRIHAPIDAKIVGMRYLPGRLLPVNSFAVNNFENLFALNERLITFIEHESGRQIAVVKVGATCVGRISVSYDTLVSNQSDNQRTVYRRYDPEIDVERGGELGVFNLGSTVVLVVEGSDFEFNSELVDDQMVQLGATLGRWGSAR